MEYKGREQERKKGTKGYKQKAMNKMAIVHPTLSIIILNINCPSIPLLVIYPK